MTSNYTALTLAESTQNVRKHLPFHNPVGAFRRKAGHSYENGIGRSSSESSKRTELVFTSLAHHVKRDLIKESLERTPQGGSISVFLSNLYLHYVLDLWFEQAIKPRLEGECYLIRYIDDFIVCFEHKSDAERFMVVLEKRLSKFSLAIEPSKTGLIEFGRYAERNGKAKGNKPRTFYFLGFTHFCTKNRKGNFRVGRKTERTRLRLSMNNLQDRIREAMHWKVGEQIDRINRTLSGHYNYYGMGGNYHSLNKMYNLAVLYLKEMLSRRSRKGYVTWELFDKIREKHPILRPYIKIPYSEFKGYAML